MREQLWRTSCSMALNLQTAVAPTARRNHSVRQSSGEVLHPGRANSGVASRIDQHPAAVTRFRVVPLQRRASPGAAFADEHADRAGRIGAADTAAIAGLGPRWLGRRGFMRIKHDDLLCGLGWHGCIAAHRKIQANCSAIERLQMVQDRNFAWQKSSVGVTLPPVTT